MVCKKRSHLNLPVTTPACGLLNTAISLKIAISVPDHFLPARYREWSGTSNFVSRYGGSNGLWLGVGKGVGTVMARDSVREQKKYTDF